MHIGGERQALRVELKVDLFECVAGILSRQGEVIQKRFVCISQEPRTVSSHIFERVRVADRKTMFHRNGECDAICTEVVKASMECHAYAVNMHPAGSSWVS